MNFETLWPKLPGPTGWLRADEGLELYKLAKTKGPKGVIVEIGSWAGRSTITLATGSKNGPHTPVYAVDPHRGTYAHRKYNVTETETAFRKNIKKFGVEDLVKPIIATSVAAAKTWTEPIKLLWIDGHHDYSLIDYLLWEPHLVKGGTIGIHDIDHYGAIKVVRHLILRSTKFTAARRIVFTIFAEKTWPNHSFTPKCSWDLLFVTVNQWLNVIAKNEDTKRPWHDGLPYTWWRGMPKDRFLHELPAQLDPHKEPAWFKWEPVVRPIQKNQAGNYPM